MTCECAAPRSCHEFSRNLLFEILYLPCLDLQHPLSGRFGLLLYGHPGDPHCRSSRCTNTCTGKASLSILLFKTYSMTFYLLEIGSKEGERTHGTCGTSI
uniref:Uncharacterized protein n=1 Tax=Cacopsylla melanoneura TaxID=428564 RepID=A0A8D8ZEF3_9HEMI